MNDLVPVLVLGIVTLGIYSIFELFVKRKERLAIIEKLSSGISPDLSKMKLDLFMQEGRTGWAIRIGCLLLGMGLGLLIVSFIDLNIDTDGQTWSSPTRRAINSMYGAAVLFFGGLGLVISYFVERNLNKNKEE